MKRRTGITLAVIAACVVVGVMVWSPWSRVSLEQATVVLPVSSISKIGRAHV